MTYEDYIEQQQLVIASLIAVLWLLLAPFRLIGIGRAEWFGLLAALYPHVEQARRESAELAREFYDAERERQTGLPDRHPMFLAEYELDWFEDAMDAIRAELSEPGTSDGTIARAIAIGVKEAENGGRRTILRAVESDPQVKGWARVAGGDDGKSCAFCLMLISRGPVYGFADTAGLDTDTTTAVELWRQIENADTAQERARADKAMLDLMTRWHTNCDCKVVPVFDRRNWPGRADYLDALRLWKQHSKGHTWRAALNSLRREIDRRESPGDRELDIAA